MNAGRALVIAPRLPEFDRESGLLRVSDLIDMLLSRGWEVTFGCLRTPTDRERYVRELEQRGVETHAPLRSLESIRNGNGFELAILAYWHVAERFLPELREALPSTRVIVDSVDLHFLREMRHRLSADPGSAPGQLETSQAGELIREINAYAAADAVLTVSEKEAALINDFAGRQDLAMTLPDTEELRRSRVPLRRRRGILFLGNFLHAPNPEAVEYLCAEVLPLLDRGTLLLARDDAGIAGFCAWNVNRRGLLGPIASRPDLVGSGTGRPLLLGALHRIRASGESKTEIAWVGPIRPYAAIGGRITRVFFVYRKRRR